MILLEPNKGGGTPTYKRIHDSNAFITERCCFKLAARSPKLIAKKDSYMETKPARRCHHVSTSGIQCGSPAAGNLRFCYYHQQSRSTAIKYYAEAPFLALEEDLPCFEDAHSIQIAIRQIASLLMQQKIEHKVAGLLLYSIQLALLNLKQLKAEKPHPAQIVMDPEKVEETLPDSAFIEATPPQSTPEAPQKPAPSDRKRKKDDEPTEEEIQEQMEYLLCLGRHLNEPGRHNPRKGGIYSHHSRFTCGRTRGHEGVDAGDSGRKNS